MSPTLYVNRMSIASCEAALEFVQVYYDGKPCIRENIVELPRVFLEIGRLSGMVVYRKVERNY